MTSPRAAEAAALFVAARREGRLLEPLPATCRPRTIAEGYEIQDAFRTSWPDALAEIESLYAGEAPPRLVFMGHSYGADSAVLLAHELRVRGIAVDLLFLIDSTSPPPVPATVGRCVQIYNPNEFAEAAPDVFPGNPILAEPGNSHTQIVNLRARVEDLGPEASGIDVASGLRHRARVLLETP